MDNNNSFFPAGYSVPQQNGEAESPNDAVIEFSHKLFTALGLAFGGIILLVVAGEWLGLLDNLTRFIPFPVGVALVMIGAIWLAASPANPSAVRPATPAARDLRSVLGATITPGPGRRGSSGTAR